MGVSVAEGTVVAWRVGVGEPIAAEQTICDISTDKIDTEVPSPATGTVIEINEDLPESPETVNEDPYGDGWLIKVKITDMSDLEELMDAEEYAELLAREKE